MDLESRSIAVFRGVVEDALRGRQCESGGRAPQLGVILP